MAKSKTGRRFGAHMSIAGGYYKSVIAAETAGCDCVQLFTKNNNQWRAKPISDDEAERFRNELRQKNISAPISHASYLINLASPDDTLWLKSIDAMIVELQRADQLGLEGVVVHPGAFVKSTEPEGLARITEAISKIEDSYSERKCWILLENTAGQGSCLGWSMEQLAVMLKPFPIRRRIGLCIDTCHAHAAGYDLNDSEQFDRLVNEIRSMKLAKRIKAIHLNDSKKPAGSRVDRHEHIGQGEIGANGIAKFINHELFRDLPMYLETPKGEDDEGVDWDVVNLQTLRKLAD